MKTKWTMIIYLAGNDLDPAALNEMEELARVGSSEDVTVLVQLDRDKDLMTRKIVSACISSYQGSGQSVTQSAMNLERIGDVVKALDAFSKELITSLDGDEKADLLNAIGSSWGRSPRFFWDSYVDLYRFTKLLRDRFSGERVRKAADDLLMTLKPGSKTAVVYQRHLGSDVRNTYGLSIYFPISDINPKYRDLDFFKDCAWGEFPERYLASRRARGEHSV